MKNTVLLTQWEKAVNRVDSNKNQWKAKSFSSICSNHFTVSNYTATKIGSIILKKDAVPTRALTGANTSQVMGMDKPSLKRRCLEVDQSSTQIVMHDHTYAKPQESLPITQSSHILQSLPIPQSSQRSSHILQSLPIPESQVPKPSHILQSMHVPQPVPLVEPEKENNNTQSGQYNNDPRLKRKIKALQQKLRRREMKARNMKQLINTLKKKLLIKQDEAELLHHNFNGLNLSLFNNVMKNKAQTCGRRYTDQIKEFAVTVHFYSPKAYNFVRTIIPLPAPSMIKSWASSVKCNPGFITEAFEILKHEIKDHPEKKDCSLVFDAMAIRKQTLWDPRTDSYVGFVDYGDSLTELPVSNVLASEALVFALVGLRSHWKCPIAYFLIDKISATIQAQLLRKALIKTAEIVLKVWCLTSDGTSSNVATFKLLGCIFRLAYKSMVTKFKHPTLDYDVFVMLDPCHMLKLARNTLASLGSLSIEEICWKFIQNLNDVQQNHGMKLANKLSTSHIKYETHKMKVDLAAQTLSSSVADAIDFLNIVEKDEQFQDSEATVTFIRTVDKVFDILNSRNPLGKGSKQPLKLANKLKWEAELIMIANYLLSLKSRDGQLLISHKRKTFILGFVTCIKSNIEMATTMLTQDIDPFKYLLTYKFSQDHIEILFSCIRARGGWNNNPNCLQLQYTLRRMLLRNSISASKYANCQILDQHSVVPILHRRKHASPLKEKPAPPVVDDEDNTDLSNMEYLQEAEHSEFTMYVLHYICGYIVSKLAKSISCSQCIEEITASPNQSQERSDHDYCRRKSADDMYDKAATFTNFVNRGGLHVP
ncbi:DNA transposase THAP9 [Paramuricea clavata]|uniref:DNA transposase THAP9 n=2 Tax=Paramuricea clavata TaxID=317549 RepID=A0A7D9HYT5_PARCT|nr:DNA transposase THAP9 [Paramuricea clavata]